MMVRSVVVVLALALCLYFPVNAEDFYLGILPNEALAGLSTDLMEALAPVGDCAKDLIVPGESSSTRKRAIDITESYVHVSVCKNVVDNENQYLFKAKPSNDASQTLPIDCPGGTRIFLTVPLVKAYTISGTVTNANTQLPVAGANVTAGTSSTTTDVDGNFVLRGLEAATGVEVTVNALWYLPSSQTYDVAADLTAANFEVTPIEHVWGFGALFPTPSGLTVEVNSNNFVLNKAQQTADCGFYSDWMTTDTLAYELVYIEDATRCANTDSYTLSVVKQGPFGNFYGATNDGTAPGTFNANYPSWARKNTFTLEAQVKNPRENIWRWRYNGYGMKITALGKLQASACVSGSGCGYVTSDETNLFADNQWHHIAYVRNNVTTSLYFDGNLLTSGPTVGDINFSTGDRLAVGGDGSAGGNFIGSIKNLRFWSEDISANIATIANTEITTPQPNLELNLLFNGALTTDGKHQDFSGFDRHLTAPSFTYPQVQAVIGEMTTNTEHQYVRPIYDFYVAGNTATWTVGAVISSNYGNITIIDVLA